MKKKEDEFYRRNLKNGISLAIGLIIVGIIFMLVMIYKMKMELDFAKTANYTEAQIIDVKYRSAEKELTKHSYEKIDVDNAEYIIVKYYVNNIEYTGVSRDISSSMYIGKEVNIYYNQENPNQFVVINYFSYIVPIIISIILVIGGIIGTIVEAKKIIRYIETLNGVEIRAEITRVIEVNRFGRKEYKIECIGKDEEGDTHTFYSRNFTETYLENEIKKMKLNTLKVRYKKYEPTKYIVLTESLEKRLSK